MMSLHKLTAGDGYTYLTRQVAAMDATERGYKSLNDYYSAKGEAPGRWFGAGLAGLDLQPGAVVTEQQMKLLFGEGRHPNTKQIEAEILSAPDGAVLGDRAKAVDRATRLGRVYPIYEASSEYRKRLGEAYQAFNTVRERASNAQIEEADRARIRSDVASAMFAEQHNRFPASGGEFSSFLATISRPVSSAIAGYDLTFTPVKSFSTLWGLTDRGEAELMNDAMLAAAQKTIRWAEQNIAYTRIGPNGVQRVPVKGLVVAAFVHRDSRAGEPNLHLHATVSGKVQALDGRWLALDGAMLHKYAVPMSEYFNAALEAEHTARVPHIRYAAAPRPDGKRCTREIAGVNPTLTSETFSSRGRQIKERTKQLIAKFTGDHHRVPTGVEQYRLAQQATLDTRQGKHEPRAEADQRRSWRAQAVAAIRDDGLRRMFRAVRAAPTSVAWSPVTAELLTKLADKTAQIIAEERASWQHNHVLAEATRQAHNAGIRPEQFNEIAPAITDQVLARSVPLGADADVPLELTPTVMRSAAGFDQAIRQLYTSPAVLAGEARIVAAAGRRDGRIATEMDVQPALAEWSANHNGAELNTSQVQMVSAIATEGRRVGLTLAPAGTGKTTAMGVLATAWQNSGGTVIGLAPSAASARELSDALGGIHADTLHKLVWEIDRTPPSTWPAWIKQIDATTLLIIDEAGLAGTPQLDAAIGFVLGRGGRVELVGDDKQQAAAGAGGILRNIAAEHGALTLDEVMRFHDDAEKAASLALRNGDVTALGYYLDHQRLRVSTPDTVLDDVYEGWAADIATGKASIMTAPTLEQVAQLNARARADRLTAAGGTVGRDAQLAGGETASAGDTILTKRNNRSLSLGGTDFVKNGDRWRIEKVHRNGDLSVTHLARGKKTTLPAAYVRESARLGYADTAVSVQGRTVGDQRIEGTSHNVIDPASDRNSFYTLMTRAVAGNYAYLPMGPIGGAGDGDGITRSETMAPPSITDMAVAILARDGSARSATTELADLTDPHRQLGRLADAYQHAIDQAATDLLGTDRLAALTAAAEQAVPGITDDAGAWPTLQAHLANLALSGADPIEGLRTAAASRELGTARGVAAALDWRLDPTGRHSQQPGPLQWLPAPAPAIADSPQWSPYLSARAQLVDAAAAAVRNDVATWTPATSPAWAMPYLSDHELLSDLALWRAAKSVDIADLRPAGPRPHPIALAHRHDDLTARALRHAGDAGDSAARWAAHLTHAGVTVGGPNDLQWVLVAQRLTLAETAGLPVNRLLATALASGPLPAEQPSSALWWRLQHHLSPAVAAQPYGSHQLRPAWTAQLAPALGDTVAERITSDRLWPSVVARMDTAIRGGADPDWLARDAAGLLAGSLGNLSPHQLATVLLWQISMLDDPPPDEEEPPVPDPAEDDYAAPEDAYLGVDEIDELDTPAWRGEPPPDVGDANRAPADLAEVLAEAWRADQATGVAGAFDPAARPVLTATEPEPDPAPLLAAAADAAEFYQRQAPGSWVPDYLRSRGLDELAASGRAGYAPSGWTSLVDHLRDRGHSDQVLLDAGLARTSRRGTLIDAYRDRLVLPIITHTGDVVSFIGRANPSAGPDVPKYINGPTTAIYTKSEQPYGLDPAAAQQLRDGATVAIVEGPLDVEAIKITAAQTGVDVVPIAAAGTALTAGHLRTINTISQLDAHQILVGFDADRAGQAAALKANELLENAGVVDPSAVAFADGADPAQTLQDHGPAELARRLTDTHPLLDTLVDDALAPYVAAAERASNDASRRHALVSAITPALNAALFTGDRQVRLGSNPYRQFDRIAEATETPLANVIDNGIHALLGDRYDDTHITIDAEVEHDPGLAANRAIHRAPACQPESRPLIDTGVGIGIGGVDLGFDDASLRGPSLGL